MSKLLQQSNQSKERLIQLEKFKFSNEILKIFREVLNYNLGHFINISTTDLKQTCQVELRRIQNARSKDKIDRNIQIDNEFSLIVIINHIRAIVDLQKINEDNMKRLSTPNHKKRSYDTQQSRVNLVVRRYQGITAEIQRNQSQIKKFMENQVDNKQEVDFNQCFTFFQREKKKLLRISNEKLISMRVNLIQVITCLLSRVITKWQPATDKVIQQLQQEEDYSNNQNQTSYQSLSYNEINKWSRMASRFLEEKLTELCSVCEQIPQLEAFNRTLQFSQLQNRQKIIFLKVVDVLISLHHRVSYLSRSKPQLLKELEEAQEELNFMNQRCQIFLDVLQQGTQDLKLISFENDTRRKGQLSEGFVHLKRSLTTLSEIIINQDIYNTQYLNKTNKLIQIVQLFAKVSMKGQFLEEWEQLIQSTEQKKDDLNNDQYKLLIILQECLVYEQNKLPTFQQLDIDSGEKANQQLSEQINKLINDYELLKDQNKTLTMDCEMFAKLREELELEIQERDNMIQNLSGVKIVLEKKINQDAPSKSRAVEDQLKKYEHEAQKYLESSLLLKEQLKVSENEREKLLQLLDDQKQKYFRTYETSNRLKLQKQKLVIQDEQLRQKIESMKNQYLRQTNRLQKQISDLMNEKQLFEMQLQTAESNNIRIMDRLQLNQTKLLDYSKLMLSKFDEKQTNQEKKLENSQNRQQEFENITKELEKVTLQFEDTRTKLLSCERDNNKLKEEGDDLKAENASLKSRLKEIKLNADKISENSQQLDDLKSKYERERNKTITIARQNEVLKENQQQSNIKNQVSRKAIKAFEQRNEELMDEVSKLRQELQRKITMISDQQNQISTITLTTCQQIKHSKQKSSRLQHQLGDKIRQNQALQSKIKKLEVQLSRQNKRKEETNQQLMDIKTKQYEDTMESHKIIEARLEQQAQQLKQELGKRIEVELKLNIQIDRLSKEIDRMKELLDNTMRELTNKQMQIKLQRNKYQQQAKIIKNYEIKIENQQKHYSTPSQQKRLEQTPSNIDNKQYHSAFNSKHSSQEIQINQIERENSLSKPPSRYQRHFDSKKYERLLKQFNDFKATSQSKNEQLIKSLRQAANHEVELADKLKNVEQEYYRLLSKNNEPFNEKSLETQDLENRLIQSQRIIKSLTEQYNQRTNTRDAQSDKQSQQNLRIKKQLELAISKPKFVEDQLRQIITDLQNKNTLLEGELAQNQFLKVENQKISREKKYLQDQLKTQNGFNSRNADFEKRLIQSQSIIKSLTDIKQSRKEPSYQKKIEELNFAILQLQNQASNHEKEWFMVQEMMGRISRQRDLIKNQLDEMRWHLEEEKKRAINNERLVASLREEFESKQANSDKLLQSLKNQRQELQRQLQHWKLVVYKLEQQKLNKPKPRINNIQYYLQKIRSLEFALSAVGDELSDSREARMISNVEVQQIQGQSDQLRLTQCIVALKMENQLLNQTLLMNPTMENLLEFLLRVLVYFLQIPLKSNQSENIRVELENISRRATGGLLFLSLEQYTVQILRNNVIEEYKRQLRAKAKELFEIKERLSLQPV